MCGECIIFVKIKDIKVIKVLKAFRVLKAIKVIKVLSPLFSFALLFFAIFYSGFCHFFFYPAVFQE